MSESTNKKSEDSAKVSEEIIKEEAIKDPTDSVTEEGVKTGPGNLEPTLDQDVPPETTPKDTENKPPEEKPNKKEVLKEPEAPKDCIYQKNFPKGFFSGNTAVAQRALAQEAGSHLLGEGTWKVDSVTKSDGTVIQFIIKGV